ncbi:TPA: hypothetical protein H2W01_004546 [Salmonella enterica]|nr:hypothetical protein [Salmonella enterica subsp. enterica serovar Oranienburg]HAK8204899.1 hypothetical protein [Salmonella enterica]
MLVKWKALRSEGFGAKENFIFMNDTEVEVSFNSNSRLILVLDLRDDGYIKTAE